MTLLSTDPCKCDHDFTEHTRKIGHSPYVMANHTDMACDVCECDDYIPLSFTIRPLGSDLDYGRLPF